MKVKERISRTISKVPAADISKSVEDEIKHLTASGFRIQNISVYGSYGDEDYVKAVNEGEEADFKFFDINIDGVKDIA